MTAPIRPVRLTDIDWEDRFFALDGASDDACRKVQASLDRLGMISPPVVWAGGASRFVIVDGFKRFEWLKAQRVEEAECRVHPEEVSRPELLLSRIETRLCGPPVNGAEKAYIVRRLSEVVPDAVIVRTYLPVLSISGKPHALDRWRRLAYSGHSLLGALASGAIHERAALDLADWGEPQAESVVLSLLLELRCSASIQVEILERLHEIAVRDGCSRKEVLGRPAIASVMNHPDLHHRQKTQAIRNLLEGWRFPRLKAAELEIRRELEEIPLPRSVSLSPPPGFEGNRWRLEIGFSEPEELRKVLQEMESVASSSRFHSLIKRKPGGKARRSAEMRLSPRKFPGDC